MLITPLVQANCSQAPEEESISAIKKLKSSIYGTQAFLSEQIMISTNWVDTFFGNKKFLEERNGSRIRLYNISQVSESDNFENDTAYRLSLRFPNLQKHLQFHLEKRASEETEITPVSELELSTDSELPNDEIRGGLSYFFKDYLDFNFKLTAGVLISLDPTPYSKFRISRDYDFIENWSTRFITTSYWDHKNLFSQSTSLDFDRVLNDKMEFRFINESTWSDSSDTLNASHGPSLYQKLSKRRVISYNFRANYSNRPRYQLERYLFSMVYRQNISKNWFFYELTPFWQFERARNFKDDPGISFKVEFIIGDI